MKQVEWVYFLCIYLKMGIFWGTKFSKHIIKWVKIECYVDFETDVRSIVLAFSEKNSQNNARCNYLNVIFPSLDAAEAKVYIKAWDRKYAITFLSNAGIIRISWDIGVYTFSFKYLSHSLEQKLLTVAHLQVCIWRASSDL